MDSSVSSASSDGRERRPFPLALILISGTALALSVLVVSVLVCCGSGDKSSTGNAIGARPHVSDPQFAADDLDGPLPQFAVGDVNKSPVDFSTCYDDPHKLKPGDAVALVDYLGTFAPIHNGHVEQAINARNLLCKSAKTAFGEFWAADTLKPDVDYKYVFVLLHTNADSKLEKKMAGLSPAERKRVFMPQSVRDRLIERSVSNLDFVVLRHTMPAAAHKANRRYVINGEDDVLK